MTRFLYKYFLAPLSFFAYLMVSLYLPKARRFFRIRQNMMGKLAKEVPAKDRFRVMVHVSSVGELLEVRPMLRALRSLDNPPYVVLSYSSPSLTDKLLQDSADLVTPSPFDTGVLVKKFLDIVGPDLIVWSSYDIWPALAWEAHDRKIPLLLVNGRLPSVSGRLRFPARFFFSRLYPVLDEVGAIDRESAERFPLLGVPSENVSITGNCRFDETLARCRAVSSDDPDLAPVPKSEFVLMLGSTWLEDHDKLLPAIGELLSQHNGFAVVIAPHEPDRKHIAELENFFASQGVPYEFYKQLRQEGKAGQRVVIVNTVGVLYKLYRKAHAAYVGGSFHQGVHNVMEPAGMGLPVMTGPAHHNSPEAEALVSRGGAFVVNNSADVVERISGWLEDPASREQAGQKALDMIQQSGGATARTMDLISKYFA